MRKSKLVGLTTLAVSAITGLEASARCAETAFASSDAAAAYAKAEHLVRSGARSFESLMALAPMKEMELNCYERGTMHLLESAIHAGDKDTPAAADSLALAIEADFMGKSTRMKSLLRLAGLYMSFDKDKALTTYETYMQAGGWPPAEDELLIAMLYRDKGQYDLAFERAESAHREATNPQLKTRASEMMNGIRQMQLMLGE